MLRDKPGIALVRNISVHGALILTRSKLAVGDDLHLNLHLTDDGPGVPVRASVVRVIARLAKREVWKYEVGVEFAAPITEYAEQVRELEAKQTRLGFAKL